MQYRDALLCDAQDQALTIDVDDNDGCLLADTLPAHHVDELRVLTYPRTAGDPALHEPQQPDDDGQGECNTKRDDNGVHLRQALSNIEDTSDAHGVVLVDDDDLAVSDQSTVQQHVGGCAG